ncbi:hypothetical protein GCM10027418_22570 [Mariniluteicoccus endophyticus]
MLIVTSNGVPGHRVEAVLGTVIGTSIRRGDGGLRSFGGGGDRDELSRVAKESRHEAIDEAWRECQARGANAVVGLKFDTVEIGSSIEVCAYGTAVVVAPIPGGEPGATPQSTVIAARPPAPQQWPTMEQGAQAQSGASPSQTQQGQQPQSAQSQASPAQPTNDEVRAFAPQNRQPAQQSQASGQPSVPSQQSAPSHQGPQTDGQPRLQPGQQPGQAQSGQPGQRPAFQPHADQTPVQPQAAAMPPRTSPDISHDDPRWLPTADGPTTDLPVAPPRDERPGEKKGSWLDLP